MLITVMIGGRRIVKRTCGLYDEHSSLQVSLDSLDNSSLDMQKGGVR